jgi:hypothetical protein
MRTVGVIQSNYIPWKGYFDIIHGVDLFVFHDDVLFTKLDWRNRNIVKTASGPRWLTIPVGAPRNRLICEVDIKDPTWARDHWSLLKRHYARAPHFKEFAPLLEDVYLNQGWTNLSAFTSLISDCAGFGITMSQIRALIRPPSRSGFGSAGWSAPIMRGDRRPRLHRRGSFREVSG